MKFCTKCGKELTDDAVICIGCGRLVESVTNNNEETVAQTDNNQTEGCTESKEQSLLGKLIQVFNCIYFMSIAFACGFAILSAIDGYISSYYVVYRPNYDLTITSFVFALLALVSCISEFILSLVSKVRGIKLLHTISRLVVGVFFFIIISCANWM